MKSEADLKNEYRRKIIIMRTRQCNLGLYTAQTIKSRTIYCDALDSAFLAPAPADECSKARDKGDFDFRPLLRRLLGFSLVPATGRFQSCSYEVLADKRAISQTEIKFPRAELFSRTSSSLDFIPWVIMNSLSFVSSWKLMWMCVDSQIIVGDTKEAPVASDFLYYSFERRAVRLCFSSYIGYR